MDLHGPADGERLCMADVQGCGGAWWEMTPGAGNASTSAVGATSDTTQVRAPDVITGRQMYFDSLAFLEDQYFNLNAGTEWGEC